MLPNEYRHFVLLNQELIALLNSCPAHPRHQAGGAVSAPGSAPTITAPPQLVGVGLEDRRWVPVDALYLAPRTRTGSPLAAQPGCVFDEGPPGPVIRTDATKMTTVPGVHAAGDAAQIRQNATLASEDGVLAGVSLHQALFFGACLCTMAV